MSNAFQTPITSHATSELTGTHSTEAAHTKGSEAESYRLAMTIAQAADDRKGTDIVMLRVSDVSYLADFFVLVTGFSSVQVRAIARSIEEKVETDWQRLPLRVEGQAEGTWILMDYGDVIAHIFMPKERQFYNLEAFWGHADQSKFSS